MARLYKLPVRNINQPELNRIWNKLIQWKLQAAWASNHCSRKGTNQTNPTKPIQALLGASQKHKPTWTWTEQDGNELIQSKLQVAWASNHCSRKGANQTNPIEAGQTLLGTSQKPELPIRLRTNQSNCSWLSFTLARLYKVPVRSLRARRSERAGCKSPGLQLFQLRYVFLIILAKYFNASNHNPIHFNPAVWCQKHWNISFVQKRLNQVVNVGTRMHFWETIIEHNILFGIVWMRADLRVLE